MLPPVRRTDEPPVDSRVGSRDEPVGRTLLLISLAVVALRLVYLRAPLTPDEGGFLVVAQQWHPGTSLYGDYWVDRPPLLIGLFRLAAVTGGLPALRLLGCLAAALTVVGTGLAGRLLGGRRSAVAAALVVGALLVAPDGGATAVNGELLAAPFVALGTLAALHAVRRGRWSLPAAVATGACASAALLVKQNMLDVGVAVVVLGLVTLVRREQPAARLARQGLLVLAGFLGATTLLLGLSWLRGTSPAGVWEAMYPFRLRAAAVMAQQPPSARVHHLLRMLSLWTATGAPVLLGAFVLALVRRRPSTPALAVAAVLAYDAVSIGFGGSYWTHYVVQLAVPTALAAGLLVRRDRPGRRSWGVWLVALVLVACTVGWVLGLRVQVFTDGPAAGEAVAAVAEPGDTLVSALGDGDVVAASGLASPYPYLWSLPAHTRDPHLTGLAAVLAGHRAPAWIVVRGGQTLRLLLTEATGPDVRRRYHQVADVCGHPVLLRDDLVRPAVPTTGLCRRPLVPRDDDDGAISAR